MFTFARLYSCVTTASIIGLVELDAALGSVIQHVVSSKTEKICSAEKLNRDFGHCLLFDCIHESVLTECSLYISGYMQYKARHSSDSLTH